MARRYSDDPLLTRRSRLDAIESLEAIEASLGKASGWLDDAGQVRAAAFVLCAQRDILAACHLLAPPDERELTRVIEQRQ